VPLTEDIRRLLGFDDGPQSNAEIQFKIKPLGAVGAAAIPSDPSVVGAGGDTAASGGPGAAGAIPTGPGNTAVSPTGFGPQGQTILTPQQQISKKNPSLITHPLGAQTDDLYESAVAQLQFDTQSRYASLLQELGFMDDSGQFMPGTLETDASRQRGELERQRELGLQDVIENAVRGGTVFSGRRAKLQSQTQQPFDSAIAELTTRLSRELANRFQGVGGLTQQFELGRNQLLAEAAERIKMGLMGGPVGGEDGGGGGGFPGIGNNALITPEARAIAAQHFAGGPTTPGATPGAPPPPRPKGMPAGWKWNAAKGYWQSPDGKNFLVPGKPWASGGGSAAPPAPYAPSGRGGGGGYFAEGI